jgi:hypothetical protein
MHLNSIDWRHTGETITIGGRCPICDKVGSWRRGVGFEHEMRCGKCQLVWEPDEKYDRKEVEKLRHKN